MTIICYRFWTKIKVIFFKYQENIISQILLLLSWQYFHSHQLYRKLVGQNWTYFEQWSIIWKVVKVRYHLLELTRRTDCMTELDNSAAFWMDVRNFSKTNTFLFENIWPMWLTLSWFWNWYWISLVQLKKRNENKKTPEKGGRSCLSIFGSIFQV